MTVEGDAPGGSHPLTVARSVRRYPRVDEAVGGSVAELKKVPQPTLLGEAGTVEDPLRRDVVGLEAEDVQLPQCAVGHQADGGGGQATAAGRGDQPVAEPGDPGLWSSIEVDQPDGFVA